MKRLQYHDKIFTGHDLMKVSSMVLQKILIKIKILPYDPWQLEKVADVDL